MKKTLLFLLLAVTFNLSAQSTTYFGKPLELNVVPASVTKSDSVLVRGIDKIVKYVPRSEFQPVVSIPTIQQVLQSGSTAYLDDSGMSIIDPTSNKYVNILGESITSGNNNTLDRTIINEKGVQIVDQSTTHLLNLATSGIRYFNPDFNWINLVFDEPLTGVNSTLRVPAKSGTLATTDDVTLQKILESGNSVIGQRIRFNEDTSLNKFVSMDAQGISGNYTFSPTENVSYYAGIYGVGTNSTGNGGIRLQEGQIKWNNFSGKNNILDFREATLSGTATFKIASRPNGYVGVLATTDQIPSIGVKVFRGLLSQTGTGDPTLIILENTTGITFTPARGAVGSYTMEGTSNLILNKTYADIGVYGGAAGNYVSGYQITDSGDGTGTMQFYTTYGGTSFDGLLQKTPIEILIYP